ncbi:MAG: hypothetical protein KH420_05540 [Clostridiales bacterium]|nr:hypothetical protein [Clostridiales bacterium]
MADEIFIPVLHSFENGNTFSGSDGSMRFFLRPQLEQEGQSHILAELWHGPLCYEKSEIEHTQVFDMTEEGRLQIEAWLKEHR